LGNCVDDEPAHLKSGVLTYISRGGERPSHKKRMVEQRILAASDAPMIMPSASSQFSRRFMVNQERPVREVAQDNDASVAHLNGDDYMAGLASEFSTLLKERSGIPFSFSMKPVTDYEIDEVKESKSLSSIKTLIEEILKVALIDACVAVSQYRTSDHRFAVFFINPSEKDPVNNKNLISALRQVIKLHTSKTHEMQVNILLVLANAQSVIENHLYKVGAKKV
jgi:hypothetical protein